MFLRGDGDALPRRTCRLLLPIGQLSSCASAKHKNCRSQTVRAKLYPMFGELVHQFFELCRHSGRCPENWCSARICEYTLNRIRWQERNTQRDADSSPRTADQVLLPCPPACV